MGRKRWRLAAAMMVCLACLHGGTGVSQEGHPLVGTWQGDWGTGPEQRQRMVLVLHWDGERIEGILNPGPNAAPVEAARLDSSTWTFRFEARTAEDPTELLVAEGRLENVTSRNRTLSGEWRRGETHGDFALARHGM